MASTCTSEVNLTNNGQSKRSKNHDVGFSEMITITISMARNEQQDICNQNRRQKFFNRGFTFVQGGLTLKI